MLTDDPGTPGSGKWEINVLSTVELDAGDRAFEFPGLDLNYGLGEHIQLKLEGAFVLLKREHHGLMAGLGDALGGVKWRFLDEERNGVSMSIYPQIEWNLAHASARRGLVNDGTHFLLPAEISRKLGWLVLDAEVGDSISCKGGDEWFYGLVGAAQVTKKLELLAELHGTNKFDGRGSELTVNVGARRELVDHVTLLLSVGHDVHAVRGEDRNLIACLGLQFEY